MTGASFHKAPARITGGCVDCQAVMEMREAEPGVFVLAIHHDDTCPTYRRIVARREGGKR